jgi:hypothetical protein
MRDGPMYATAVGLALHESYATASEWRGPPSEGPGWGRMRERVVEWFREFF